MQKETGKVNNTTKKPDISVSSKRSLEAEQSQPVGKAVSSITQDSTVENSDTAKISSSDDYIIYSGKIKNSNAINIPKRKKDAIDGILYRIIEGKEVAINLKKPANKRIEYPRTVWRGTPTKQKTALEVIEIYPHVLEFRSMFKEKRWDAYENRHYEYERAIPTEIQFFDKDYKYLRSFYIRENNPFLKDTIVGAKLTEYFYNIAEFYSYLPKSEQKGTEKISDQWVYAGISLCESLPIEVIYRTEYATKQNDIIGGKYLYILLDSLGNKINEFTTDYQQLSGAAFTPDAKYAMIGFTQGETTINAGVKSEPEGFELWDLEKKQLLHRETNDNPNMWITNPTYLPDLKILGIGYTYPLSVNPKYKKDKNNPASMSIHFNIDTKELYSYYVTIGMREESFRYLDKHRKYKSWDEIFPTLNIIKKQLNYGK